LPSQRRSPDEWQTLSRNALGPAKTKTSSGPKLESRRYTIMAAKKKAAKKPAAKKKAAKKK